MGVTSASMSTFIMMLVKREKERVLSVMGRFWWSIMFRPCLVWLARSGT